jgi:hypothetical protein
MLRVFDGVADFQVPQTTKGPRIGNQIDAAMIFAQPDFVKADRD